MNRKILTVWGSLLLSVQALATMPVMELDEAKNVLSNLSPEVQAVVDSRPERYEFFNEKGQDTVSYTGQTLRQILTYDMKLAFGSMNRGEFQSNPSQPASDLTAHYLYNKTKDGLRPIQVKVVNEFKMPMQIFEGKTYSKVVNDDKNLAQKMAGVDNDLRFGEFYGWNSEKIGQTAVDQDGNGAYTPDELVRAIIKEITRTSTEETALTIENPGVGTQEVLEAHISEDGIDMAEFAQKILYGALFFSQAAEDYLSTDLADGKGLLADNDKQSPRGFTTLQHHWDEAFGYFGAARNYLEYDDKQIYGQTSLDAYKSERTQDDSGSEFIAQLYSGISSQEEPDFKISLQSEKNFAAAIYAANRDVSAADEDEDFTFQIMNGFLTGRHLLQEKPEGYLEAVRAYATVTLYNWERLYAASAIHYINSLVGDLQKVGSADFQFASMAKHFGEMKGFALAFQFNPGRMLTDDDLLAIHQLMGDKPDWKNAADYEQRLLEARTILSETYEFSDNNVKGW